MDDIEILKSIIIPIISAIIGGMCTFLGVFITILHEKRKEEEERLLANKPLFYRLDSRQEYDYKKAVDFYLGVRNLGDEAGQIFGVIKNTDNAVLIIEGVSVNGKLYKSLFGDVVDKNQIFNFHINVSEKINKEDEIIFIVKDIMENKYEYRVETKNKDEKYSEIIGFKEIKKRKTR